jgi:hypothetical protein
MRRLDVLPPSDSGFAIEKARGRFRRGPCDLCDDVTLPVICPTCQTLTKMQLTKFAKVKLNLQVPLRN